MRSENMGKQAEEVTICPTNGERLHRNIIRALMTQMMQELFQALSAFLSKME